MFYVLPKVHKTPILTRPVVSCINSFSAAFSTWFDYKMSTLLPLIPSYLKTSADLLHKLQALPPLPQGSKLFTADTIAMYTNIKAPTAIGAFKRLLAIFSTKTPPDFPHELFLKSLEIIMNENMFQLDDTYWLQLEDTAMGTPAACMYATISYGIHEIEYILDRFKNTTGLYKRYKDDIFRVWTPTPNHQLDAAKWLLFTQALNGFGKYQWKVEELSDTTNFLDLTLTLIDGKIQ